MAGKGAQAATVVQTPAGLTNVGGSCGVAVVVQLLYANVDVRKALAAASPELLGGNVWRHLGDLFVAMERRVGVEPCLEALIREWEAEGILVGFEGGIDPADVLLRLLQWPNAVSLELKQLATFTLRCESSCWACGAKDTVETPQISYIACEPRPLQSQVDRLPWGARTCSCGGTSQDQSVTWSSLGAILLVQGDSPFNTIPGRLRLRVAREQVDVILVAVFEDYGAHHRLHLRSRSANGGGQWWLFDDAVVSPTARVVPEGEGMFRPDESRKRSSFWAYARQVVESTHAYNVGLQQPCGDDCGEPSCSNQNSCGRVHEGVCSWLRDQKGLFASADLRRGSWVARFDMSQSPAAGGGRGPGGFKMQVSRFTGKGLGAERVAQHLTGGVAMLANATCCQVHRNAVIAQDADDNVWIRVTADVRVGEEILVDYGARFFTSEVCVCCACSGRCSSQLTEYAKGGW